ESAIVAADGTVCACHDSRTSTILWADLDLSDPDTLRLRAEKRRGRRPDLYQGALVDLTSAQLRACANERIQPEARVITVSGEAIDRYTTSDQLNDVIATASRDKIPVVLVLPALDAAKHDIQAHIRFASDKKLYLACGYIEN